MNLIRKIRGVLGTREKAICLFLGFFFSGCAVDSVYNGGMGAFSDYEGLKAYRSKKYTPNFTNQMYNDKYDSSMLSGMRDSEAIQRATMRPYQVGGRWYYPTRVDVGEIFDGIASWYGPNFHSKKTSNGEIYNMHAHTAASKVLPINTVVRVYNKENAKSTVVRINDRGPFIDGRIIDLSNAAAREINMVDKGTAMVRLEVLGFGGIISTNYQKSVVKNMKESKSLKEEFKIGESQNSIEGGDFSLQVGAFKRKDGAVATKEKYQGLVNTDYKVAIKEQSSNGEIIYRVFVKGFKSEDEAFYFIKNKGINGMIIRE